MRHPLNSLPSWTGFRCRTLWDWMSLLIVPLVIVAAAAVFSYFESEREYRRAQDIVLQSYIQDMSGLLLDRGLATSEPDQAVRDIARASTLTVVRQLDGDRKGILLQFLYESDLIKNEDGSGNPTPPIIYLGGADLRDAILGRGILSDANLSSANLENANLSRGILSGANLIGANLSDADLSGANLRGANLIDADLSRADLRGANLSRADLSDADLSGANLSRRADLSGANLSRADLSDVDLERATNLTNQELAQAESLVGATLPDGTVMTEEVWEEFQERYRQ